MRSALALALALAIGLSVLLPATASAGTIECRRLTRRVEHFSGMVERARALDNEMWEERTQQHLDLLIVRRAARCPEYAEDDSAMRALAALMKLAARAAITYFTFGAL
jgi:hypothetical protein